MKIGAIIQARMTSKRFPGKVLYKIAGKPMLEYLLERIVHCNSLDKVVVATSREASDIPIVNFCKEIGAACYQGPLFDVAGRFKEALRAHQFDGFVRVTGDSPLLDSQLIDKGIETFRHGRYEIVTNVLKRTYPAGQSVEILRSTTFINGYGLMRNPDDLEHVTSYFYKNYKDFKIFNFASETDYSAIQLSVDTPEDMDIVASIIKRMDKPHWQYGLEEILRIYQEVSRVEYRS